MTQPLLKTKVLPAPSKSIKNTNWTCGAIFTMKSSRIYVFAYAFGFNISSDGLITFSDAITVLFSGFGREIMVQGPPKAMKNCAGFSPPLMNDVALGPNRVVYRTQSVPLYRRLSICTPLYAVGQALLTPSKRSNLERLSCIAVALLKISVRSVSLFLWPTARKKGSRMVAKFYSTWILDFCRAHPGFLFQGNKPSHCQYGRSDLALFRGHV